MTTPQGLSRGARRENGQGQRCNAFPGRKGNSLYAPVAQLDRAALWKGTVESSNLSGRSITTARACGSYHMRALQGIVD